MYLFGYGSLMWRHGFEPTSVRWGVVAGYERRFYQHSTDHRGTPEAPGRVVTLVDSDQSVFGALLGVPNDPKLMADLDFREKDGYTRETVNVLIGDEHVEALTYIAHPSNPGFLGPSSLSAMATQIRNSVGPSGRNDEYLFQLEKTLLENNRLDPHIAELANAVRAL